MKHAVGDDARNTRSSSLALPILGVAIAIAGATTMDATGLMEWNRLCVFGFGTKTGALGIRDTAIFGPEIGILGLIGNAVFAFYSGNGGEHAVIARRRSRRSDRSVPLIRTRSCARTTQHAGPAIQARVPQNVDR